MKRIIDGKTYNTETATQIGTEYTTDSKPNCFERLYQSRHGAYFLHRRDEGWIEEIGEFGSFERIEPKTHAEAQRWMEDRLEFLPALIEEHFGKMPEAGQDESRFTLRIPAVLKGKIDRLASDRNQSTNAWMIRCLEREPPRGWSADSLSDFLESAYRNRFASLVNKNDWFQRLTRLDGCFVRIGKNWINPSNILTPHLFVRCHSAYRAACEHALAGQVAETFPLVRACLEYAGYALHIHATPSVGITWLERHKDEATLKAVKTEFKISNIRATIEKTNRHAAKRFDELYQRAIDFGGHANERAATGSCVIKKRNGSREYQQIYLHGDDLSLDHALKTTANTGACALEIFQEVFGPRFEILGVRAEMLELRRGL